MSEVVTLERHDLSIWPFNSGLMVAPGGYRWRDGIKRDGGAGRFLVSDVPVLGPEAIWRTIDPLADHEMQGAAKEFATLSSPLTESTVQDFASRYGHLDPWANSVLREGQSPQHDTPHATGADALVAIARATELLSPYTPGETLESWQEIHVLMVETFRLFDDWQLLSRSKGADSEVESDRRASAQHTRWMLREVLDLHLRTSTWAGFGRYGGDGRLRIRPRHLAGAMWLQIARAVDEDREYRSCAGNCGRWLVIAPGASRRQKLTCSDACRSRRSRMKREGRALSQRERRSNDEA
ncbi:MAG: hypothetical protein O7A71_11475 [Chloroflexi bacterium]|nr:hypothetical protein [Chloroflexota bacterium]